MNEQLRTAALAMLEALIYCHAACDLNQEAKEQVTAAIAKGQAALTISASRADVIIQSNLS